jgi:serine/threonine-protein phosphatase 4 regulatory subunit 1
MQCNATIICPIAEPSVRAELMEQVPHIAMYCQEFKAKLSHVVPESLLPMVVKFLTDFDIQVRKTSQAALLVLLEQGLVEKADVKEQVCPVIIRLTEADSLDDYRTEAVAVSARIFFIPHLVELFSHFYFFVFDFIYNVAKCEDFI